MNAIVDWDETKKVPSFNEKRYAPRSGSDQYPGRRDPTCGDLVWADPARKETTSAYVTTLCREQKNGIILHEHHCGYCVVKEVGSTSSRELLAATEEMNRGEVPVDDDDEIKTPSRQVGSSCAHAAVGSL